MNVGLQKLITLTRRFLQVEKKSFDIDENFRPSLELEGLGLLPGEVLVHSAEVAERR